MFPERASVVKRLNDSVFVPSTSWRSNVGKLCIWRASGPANGAVQPRSRPAETIRQLDWPTDWPLGCLPAPPACSGGRQRDLPNGLGEAREDLVEDGRRRAEVEADTAVSGFAKVRTVHQPDFRPVEEELKWRSPEVEAATVEPGQVRRLRHPVLDPGHLLRQEVRQRLPVDFEDREHLFEPGLAVPPRRDGGIDPDDVRRTEQPGWHPLVETLFQLERS